VPAGAVEEDPDRLPLGRKLTEQAREEIGPVEVVPEVPALERARDLQADAVVEHEVAAVQQGSEVWSAPRAIQAVCVDEVQGCRTVPVDPGVRREPPAEIDPVEPGHVDAETLDGLGPVDIADVRVPARRGLGHGSSHVHLLTTTRDAAPRPGLWTAAPVPHGRENTFKSVSLSWPG